MQLSFITLIASATFSLVSSECFGKVAIDVCISLYRETIDHDCKTSPNSDTCYCQSLPSISACYQHCIDEPEYAAKQAEINRLQQEYCSKSKSSQQGSQSGSSNTKSGIDASLESFLNSDGSTFGNAGNNHARIKTTTGTSSSNSANPSGSSRTPTAGTNSNNASPKNMNLAANLTDSGDTNSSNKTNPGSKQKAKNGGSSSQASAITPTLPFYLYSLILASLGLLLFSHATA